MTQVNLTDVLNNPHLKFSLASFQTEHPKDAQIRRFKEVTLFVTTIVLSLCMFWFCGLVLVNNNNSFSIDDKKWATAISSGMISAYLGFLTGEEYSLTFD